MVIMTMLLISMVIGIQLHIKAHKVKVANNLAVVASLVVVEAVAVATISIN